MKHAIAFRKQSTEPREPLLWLLMKPLYPANNLLDAVLCWAAFASVGHR